MKSLVRSNPIAAAVMLMALTVPFAGRSLAQFAGGTGTLADPYLVETPTQLDAVRDFPAAHFRQVAPVDLVAFTNWVPIGSMADSFTGTYTGTSNTIKNLTIDRPGEDYVGLFGYMAGSSWVRHLVLTNVLVVGSNSVGAVGGYSESGYESKDIHVWGSVTGHGNGVGGLFGRFNGTLSDCTADMSVEGRDAVAGMVGANMPYHSSFGMQRCVMRGSVKGRNGVAGLAGARGSGNNLVNYASVEGENTVAGVLSSTFDRTLNYAVNHGTVTASGNTVGGIAASMTTSGYGGSLNYCYNFGAVSGSNSVGGILGSASVGLTYAYNLGAVTGIGSVGGLIGSYHRGIYSPFSAISFGYNAGPVSGNVNAHALLGSRSSSSSTLPYTTRSYYDNEVSGVEDALAVGRSTVEMIQQVTFEGWDFDALWSIGHEGRYTYPYMQWQGTNDVPYVDLTIPFASDVHATGTDSVGETVTGHYTFHPNSAGEPEGATSFRWLRADAQAGPFVAIADATNQTYTLVAGDENKWYQFEVTVRDTEDNVGAPVSAILVFTQGRGTADDPWLISNATQLDRLRHYLGSTHSTKHFVLATDMDLGASPWNEGTGWEPIGKSATESFQGKLNGRGHVIRNLTIDRPSDNYQGLFGYLSGAEIVLLGLEDASVVGNRYVGALAGFSLSSGVRHGYAHGHVEGAQDTGGFIGYNSSSTIQWSYSTASVTGGTSNVGGFLGFGASHACYWDMDASGKTNSGNGTGQTGLTTEAMRAQDSYVGWNFYSLWQIEADQYPAFQDLSGREEPQPLTLDDLPGAGTPENPYLIGNVQELNAMRLGLSAHYRLTNDIDMADTVLWDMARGWTPVGSLANKFTGTLDGAGHTISNLTIVRLGTSYQALFGYTENARIEDLTLSRAYVVGGGNYTAALVAFASATELRSIEIEELYLEGSAFTGGLVGYAQSGCAMEFVRVQGVIQGANDTGGLAGYLTGGTVHACETDVTVSGATYVGGLIGRVGGGANLYHCHSEGDVSGGSQVGGLIGHFTTATMSDCFSHAAVDGTSNVGGLIGYMGATSTSSTRARVFRSFSTGPVTGTSAVGGLVGAVNHAGNNMVFDSYWDTETSRQTGSARGTGQDTAAMQSAAGYPEFNFTTRWHIDEGTAYPKLRDMSVYTQPQTVDLADLSGDGTAENPYIILTLDQLNAIRLDVTTHYRLGAHIDATATVAWNAGQGWIPIGVSASRFSGSLDGAAFAIRNLTINRPITDYQGLFAFTQNAMIRDLDIEQFDIRGGLYTGGLIAFSTVTRVEFVQGTALKVSGGSDTGGLIGYASGGQLHALTCDAVTRGDTRVGGLIGNTAGGVTIYHSRYDGSVEGVTQVGGLVGHLYAATMTDGYSHATVAGGSNAGGLIGYMGASASASRARVFRSFSTGPVSGSSAVGGLVGAVNAVSHNIEADCYWDMDTSSVTNSARGTGKSTAEMQQRATYRLYNFVTLWQMDEGNDYPGFRDLAAYTRPVAVTLDRLDGSGTETDPYIVTTLDELDAMRLGLTNHFRLAADIDASCSVAWNAGQGWAPIGTAIASAFQGGFQGGGHTISNLTVNRPITDYVGLFGYMSVAQARDLKLRMVNMSGGSYVGGLVGQANGCGIDGVGVTGIVGSQGTYAGGLVGVLSAGWLHRVSMDGLVDGKGNEVGGLIGYATGAANIQSSFTLGQVHGVNNVGGLVGNHFSGTLTDGYSHMAVHGASSVGGAVGVHGGSSGNNGYLYRVYSAGAVNGTGTGIGGLVGTFSRGTVNESYWDMDTSGQTNSVRGAGYSTEEMQLAATYRLHNFVTLWQIDEGIDYPVFRDLIGYAQPAEVALADLGGDGTEATPYLVTNADELNAIRKNLTAHYRLANDIDLSASVVWNAGQGWEPLGSSASINFSGSLDGAGHTISNLVVTRPNSNYQAFMGYLSGANVSNLVMAQAQVYGGSYVGGLAGQANGSEINGVGVTGIVGSQGTSAGGLAGVLSAGWLHRVSMDGLVDGKGNEVGGLIGYATGAANIQSSFTLGQVHGVNNVGGLVGNHYNGTLTDAYSRMEVHGASSVGGAVGVNGAGTGQNGNLYRVYSAGAVEGSGSSVGGLVGAYSRGTVSQSYWDREASGQASSIRGEGRSTLEMTYPHDTYTTYIGWDFLGTWSQDIATINAGYPRILSPSERNLIYLTGVGGAISGPTPQVVLAGHDGTQVEAVPDAGASFHRWSDGFTGSTRTDTNVQSHLMVQAVFRSTSGADLDWYSVRGIAPEPGETWADVDARPVPVKGTTLFQENIADTDPHDLDEIFEILAIDPGPPVTITFRPGSTERIYRLITADDLVSGVWTNVPGVSSRPGAGKGPTRDDTIADPHDPPVGSFYRMEVQLPE